MRIRNVFAALLGTLVVLAIATPASAETPTEPVPATSPATTVEPAPQAIPQYVSNDTGMFYNSNVSFNESLDPAYPYRSVYVPNGTGQTTNGIVYNQTVSCGSACAVYKMHKHINAGGVVSYTIDVPTGAKVVSFNYGYRSRSGHSYYPPAENKARPLLFHDTLKLGSDKVATKVTLSYVSASVLDYRFALMPIYDSVCVANCDYGYYGGKGGCDVSCGKLSKAIKPDPRV